MAFSSYTELQSEIADLLNRGDLTAKIPSWIALVEAKLQRILEGKEMRTTLPIVLDTTGQLTLPTDLRSPVSLTLETTAAKGPLELTTYEALQTKRAQLGTGGLPAYAAVVNGLLYVAPVPGEDQDAVLIYDAALAPLSNTNTSNWVLANHPDIYLYGAALHSAPYLQHDERIEVWEHFYNKAIDEVRLLRDRAEFGANTPIIRRKSALGEI